MARICGALRDLVPFVQYKKCEKQLTVCNFTKINTPPGVFFTFFKLYKWYQIAQRITYLLWSLGKRFIRLQYIKIFEMVQKSDGKIVSKQAGE